MHIYSSSEYNQTGAFYRLVDTIKRAKKNNRPFTIFIGAGCSLSSSKRNINTEQIILNSLKEHFDRNYTHPGSWEALYRDFVNNVWGTLGKEDRREILDDYFLNLIPGDGYNNLRLLVENGYISNIITTNFDMLLDDSLQGLSYNVKIGKGNERKIKGGSLVHLLKVHGDIENGQLRFAPDELVTLPEELSMTINSMTFNNCLICGYSGQDIGVMKSLNFASKYSVYWSSPCKPIKSDIFDSKMIYDWMEKRESIHNFIFGELGKFDVLMKKLVSSLLDVKPIKNENVEWQGSTIIDSLKINHTVYRMFQDILECSNNLSREFNWEIKFPFYSPDYETTLRAFLYFYKKNGKTQNIFLQTPENEIEALLIGVVLDAIAHTSGLDISANDYITKLQENFQNTVSEYGPDLYFWKATKKILSIYNNEKDSTANDEIPQIKLNLNNTGLLTFNMKNPQIKCLADIIITLGICGLFVPTYDAPINSDLMSENKLLLQSVSENYNIEHDPINFYLGTLDFEKFENVYQIFFKEKQFTFDQSGKIIGPHVVVSANLTKNKPQKKEYENLFDYLKNLSNNQTTIYLKAKTAFEVDNLNYVSLDVNTEISNFIESTKKAMYIIGASGAGKTKTIQNLVSTYDKDKFIIYALSPKHCRIVNNFGVGEFFPDLFLDRDISPKEVLRDISLILRLRNKQLILIYDGLNEISGGFEVCLEHYKGLSESINILHELEVDNIKLIVTCREHIFEEYCDELNIYPDIEYCYCHVDKEAITPYYRMPPLDLDSQKKIAMTYFNNSKQLHSFIKELETNFFFRNTFNQPYLIALAAKYFDKKSNTSIGVSIHNIFSYFTKQMICQLSNKQNIALAHEIFNNYFALLIHTNPFNRRITKFILINSFDTERKRKNISIVLSQLNDVNIFSTNNNCGYIHFSHDRIEEYLLAEFLYISASNSHILERAIQIASEDQIFCFALQNYFKRCISEQLFNQILDNIDNWYALNSNMFPSLLVGGLGDITQDTLIQLFSCLKFQQKTIERFMQILIEGIKHTISSETYEFPEILFSEFKTLSELFPVLEIFEQQLFFLASRFYYLQKNNLELSEYYCDLALNAEKRFQNIYLAAKFQKAVLLDKNGEIDCAISKFSQLYTEFILRNDLENATECVLEWGGALREKTLFSKALEVYKKIDVNTLNNRPDLCAKIHRRMGTIYKNQMQQITQDAMDEDDLPISVNREEAIRLYRLANQQFELAYSRINCTKDIVEKIKILSEETENALRIVPILPKQRHRADYCHQEEASLLAIAPIPDKRILYLRECAILNEMDKHYSDAIDDLLEARKIALEKGLVYRQFEVNYQIGHLVERVKSSLTINECNLGLQAINDALDFKLDENNIYYLNCLKVQKKLSDYLYLNKQ